MAVVDLKREKAKWRKFIAEGGGGGGGSSFVTEVTPGGEPVSDSDLGSVSLLVTAANAQPGSGTDGVGNPIAADIGGVTFDAVAASGGVAEVVNDQDGPFGEQWIRVDDFPGLTNANYQYDPGVSVFDAIDFQGDDWTIEFHFRSPEANGTLRDVLGAWEFTERLWQIQITTQTPGDFRSAFSWSTTGSNNAGGSQQLWGVGALDTWYHLAIVREGTDIRFYVDGTQYGVGETPGAAVFNSGSSRFVIGGSFNGGSFESHIANLRITKGVARYSANFTAPAVPYEGSDTILQIGDVDKRLQLIGPTVQVDANLYIAQLAKLGVIDGFGQLRAVSGGSFPGRLAYADDADVQTVLTGNNSTEQETTADLEDITSSINTIGKYIGKPVWNTTTSRIVWAVGAATNDVWTFADGTTAHTPV